MGKFKLIECFVIIILKYILLMNLDFCKVKIHILLKNMSKFQKMVK